MLRGGGFYGVILEAKRTTEDNEMQTTGIRHFQRQGVNEMLDPRPSIILLVAWAAFCSWMLG